MPLNTIQLQLLKVQTASRKAVLVAVSKTRPVTEIEQAYQSGQRDFGENYVQELIEKQKQLPADIHWHFIGHLQRNKVKFIAPFVFLIHGVDSLNLLKEINKQALLHNRIIPCLLQVHIAEEESKFGFDASGVELLLASEDVRAMKNIKLCGLMGMATNTENEEQVRREFHSLGTLFKALQQPYPDFKILSMGMTTDYRIALEEGSTMVRIGSAIFGERTQT